MVWVGKKMDLAIFKGVNKEYSYRMAKWMMWKIFVVIKEKV